MLPNSNGDLHRILALTDVALLRALGIGYGPFRNTPAGWNANISRPAAVARRRLIALRMAAVTLRLDRPWLSRLPASPNPLDPDIKILLGLLLEQLSARPCDSERPSPDAGYDGIVQFTARWVLVEIGRRRTKEAERRTGCLHLAHGGDSRAQRPRAAAR